MSDSPSIENTVGNAGPVVVDWTGWLERQLAAVRPTVLDLAPFPLACVMLRKFARRPWDTSILLILADWLDEHSSLPDNPGDKLRHWIREGIDNQTPHALFGGCDYAKMTRTERRAEIAHVKSLLRVYFGDYDQKERERDIPF